MLVAGNFATPYHSSPWPLVRARSSAGEHYVDIVGVTGSIPVAPTIISKGLLGRWKPDLGLGKHRGSNQLNSTSAACNATVGAGCTSRRAEACELLGPIYGSFTEGFDTPDLEEPTALLNELS